MDDTDGVPSHITYPYQKRHSLPPRMRVMSFCACLKNAKVFLLPAILLREKGTP